MSSDAGKPRSSGVDDTLPAESVDETLPASGVRPADEALPRASRASLPPMPTQRYRMGTEIGRGGMGRVVEAFDTQLGRVVALKEVLPTGQSVVRRFVREIEITARLEHASIVPLYDSGTTADGRPFYVMKRVTGRPLDEEIRRATTLDERLTLLPAMLAAIDAIAHAHRRGVIHRDLKPSNILVGELGQTTVIDWGLAKVIGETDEPASIEPRIPTAADSLQTQVGSVFGTPGFMSPEQARGEELTPTVDVYALGATLYQLLAGKPPMGGTSATELIGKTLVHDVTPLAQVVEGVPRDLVAIVDKALSFDASVRYRDAGELAADVRRFQAGQLVAAHQYTRGQRLAKFARRNRTVLGVVGIALATVAVLGTFSVRRILAERDAANEARQQALVEKRAAEEARDRLAERNDALTITRARALLDTNPTHALVAVADMSASSPRYGEAVAIAQAAVARGVWWGMAGPDEPTRRAELSPDGTHLVQVTNDSTLRVWDLERRRLVLARPYDAFITATWAGERVLVYQKNMPAELLEPSANHSTPLPGPPLTFADASITGEKAIATEAGGRTVLIDLRTFERTTVWPGHVANQVQIADDGSWMLLRDKTTAVVLDGTGAVLTQHPDDEMAMALLSRSRRAALVSTTGITELVLDPQPTWRTYPVRAGTRSVLPLAYNGARLNVLVNFREIHTLTHEGPLPTSITIEGPQLPPLEARDAIGLVTATGMFFHNDAGDLTVPIPVALADVRYASRAGSNRVVVLGRSAIMIAELTPVLPRPVYLEGMANHSALDATTVLGWHANDGLTWVDITTGKRTAIALRGFGEPFAFDELGGRVALLVREEGASSVYVVRRGSPDAALVVRGKDPWIAFHPGDAISYGASTPGNPIKARFADGTEKQLGELGTQMRNLGVQGRDVILLGTDGRLLRFNVERGLVDQTKVHLGDSTVIASDNQSRIAIAIDNRILTWANNTVTEVASVPKRIANLYVRTDGTAFAFTADNAVFAIPLTPGATPQLLLSSSVPPTIDPGRTRVAAAGAQHDVTIVDLATKATWTLPPIGNRLRSFDHRIVADGALYIDQVGLHMSLRNLPTVHGDLAAWAREHTSAKLVDDTLVWPWQ